MGGSVFTGVTRSRTGRSWPNLSGGGSGLWPPCPYRRHTGPFSDIPILPDLRLDCLLERRRDFPSLSRWPWDHLPTLRSPAPKRTLSGSGGDIAVVSPINTRVDFPGSALTQIKRRSGYPKPRSKRPSEGAIAFQQVDPGQSTKSKIYKDALTARYRMGGSDVTLIREDEKLVACQRYPALVSRLGETQCVNRIEMRWGGGSGSDGSRYRHVRFRAPRRCAPRSCRSRPFASPDDGT